MKKNVLIVGMARSGTSMTSAIFSRCGYYVAENGNNQLQKADKFNPSGYWEAEKLLKSNNEVLSTAGFKCENTWFHKRITPRQISDISNIPVQESHRELVEEYNQNQPWIWKDPRLCYTLKYWWPLLDQNNTCVLLLKREPNEIYHSFLRVKDTWNTTIEMTKDEIYLRIQEHIDSAEKILSQYNIPHITVHYSDYKESPEKIAKELSLYFGVKLNKHDIGYKKTADHSSLIGKLSLMPELISNTTIVKKIKHFILKH